MVLAIVKRSRMAAMRDHRNRREFVGLTAAGVAGALTPRWLLAATAWAGDPDLVVINAKVYTMDPAAPRAEAVAVKGGRFVAVGTSAEIKALAGRRTQTFDAKQMTMVPGFTDCHNHAGGTTLLYEVLVGNPFEVEFVTIASIVDKLKAKAKTTPPGTWVEGYFFDDTKLKDKRPLNMQDLDQVSTEHPVAVQHRGGHTTFYNSKAFELAKITKDTPNPAGGTFDRDATGALNGRVTDRARNVFGGVGMRQPFNAAERAQRERDGIAHISKQFVRYGLTTVHHEGGDLDAIQDVVRAVLKQQLGQSTPDLFRLTGPAHQLLDNASFPVQRCDLGIQSQAFTFDDPISADGNAAASMKFVQQCAFSSHRDLRWGIVDRH